MKKIIFTIFAITLTSVMWSQEEMKSTFQGKHHMISESELGRETENSKSFVETAPPTGEIRPIAEFEPMEAVIVAYMGSYGTSFGIPVELIASMSEVVTVITIVDNSSQESDVLDYYSSNGVTISNCDFLYAPTDSYWTRDYSPWFIAVDDVVSIINFPYNRPRPDDNDIPIAFANEFGYDLYGMNVTHTGGNYMCDGIAIAASTEIAYEENDDQTPAQVDAKFADYMGVTEYHVVNDPLGDYIKHIDCWGKFLDVDKILISQVPSSNPQYDEYEATADYFANAISSYGTNYEVYRVYSPNGQPYTNSLILNNRVFVAIVDGSAAVWNDDAIATYQQAMPGYEVIGFYEGVADWQTTDALHCRTKEVPDRGMLHIFHIPTQGNVPYSSEYPISAEIIPYSGANVSEASLFYNVDGGTFNQLTMINTGVNTFEVSIPELPANSEVGYYIHAEDDSPRNANHPFIGAPDPHIFVIGNSTAVNSFTDSDFKLMVYPNPVKSELFVNLFSEINVNADLSIIDINGKTLVQDSFKLIPGNKIKQYDVSQFVAGIYVVSVRYGNQKTVIKKFLVD